MSGEQLDGRLTPEGLLTGSSPVLARRYPSHSIRLAETEDHNRAVAAFPQISPAAVSSRPCTY